jgi:NAD(P)-dependent dehydrogenase (short-subunit alcohol dehydrogenase family)
VSVVLVTGATSGLGRGVAIELAQRGATVLVHGRDQAKIDAVVGEIGSDKARGYRADLSSLAGVESLARAVVEGEERLEVLVNNAGVAVGERQESADGIELDFAVNHLAGFVLTGRLLPLLRRSAPARIVNVASIGQAPLDPEDPLLERDWESFRAYAQSKLAQIAFTVELAERLGGDAGVTVNALHPATLMDTEMVRSSFGRAQSTIADGVGPVVRLALDDDVAGTSGQFFDQTRAKRADAQAYDPQARAFLWDLSVKLAGSDPY